MEGITLCVGLAAAALVLLLPPRYGLLVYLIALLCYPDYLRFVVFGCTVSTGRLVVTALLMRCLLDEQLRREFRWTKIDTLIIAADAVYMLVLSLAATGFLAGIKYQSGIMVDTTFTYFSIRLIINNRAVLVRVVKMAAVILVVMALLGAYEAVTAISPYNGLMKYGFNSDKSPFLNKVANQETIATFGHEKRLGFFRAQGPHSHSILFGASFVLFLPFVWKLFYNTRWKNLRIPIFGVITVGGASSMSSTPFSGLLAMIGCLVFERFERWGERLLVLLVLSCLFLEVYTDRSHFYYAFLGRLSINAGNGYFRGQIIDAAMGHLPEYWLTGYGLRDPGWGQEINGRDFTDVTVHYVFLAVMYGVFGLLAYLAIVFSLLFSLWRKYRRSVETFVRSTCWAVIVSIIVTLVLDFGVIPFGALAAVYSIIFGIGGSVLSAGFDSQYAIRNTRDLLAANSTWH